MDIYSYELSAYKREIQARQNEIDEFIKKGKEKENLTHFSLGVSNRGNLMIIGLCSLVEVFLYNLSIEEELSNSFKIDDLKGDGLKRLQKYLSRTERVDFGKIQNWGEFTQIYTIRNALVHSYGGLIETSFIKKVNDVVSKLKIDSVLVGGRRICLSTDVLLRFHSIVESLINELKQNTSNTI